jgi:hypothetical protein
VETLRGFALFGDHNTLFTALYRNGGQFEQCFDNQPCQSGGAWGTNFDCFEGSWSSEDDCVTWENAGSLLFGTAPS